MPLLSAASDTLQPQTSPIAKLGVFDQSSEILILAGTMASRTGHHKGGNLCVESATAVQAAN
jgi:hypothetical protein